MKTIWKYSLQPTRTGTHVIKMREGARILSVQMQSNRVCLWAAVDPGEPDEERKFYIAFTGGGLPDKPLQFLDTVQLHDGGIVIHVFEETFIKGGDNKC